MRNKRKSGKIKVWFALMLFLVAVAFIGWKLIERYSLSDEKADLNEYFGISENQIAIIVDDKISDKVGLVSNDEVYIPLDIVQTQISPRFYVDKQRDILMYVLPTGMLSSQAGENTLTNEMGNEYLEYAPLIKENDNYYLATDFIKEYAKCTFNYQENPCRVQINTELENLLVAEVDSDTQIRILGGVKSPILREIKSGTEVHVIKEGKPWTKVRSEDGFIGYIQDKYLVDKQTKNFENEDYIKLDYKNIKKDYKISLMWDQLNSGYDMLSFAESDEDVKGINVVAPVLFSSNDIYGNIEKFGDEDYVNNVHQKGYEVWGVLNDFDGGINSVEDTHTLLADTNARESLIDNVISEAKALNLDGINIDFEKVSEESALDFLEFLREMYLGCKNNNLVLSVDNYSPTFTKYYNRKEEAVFVDYFVVMAYDEHGSWSEKLGPIASKDYVEVAIKSTIKEGVPKEKVIQGIPLYTTVWNAQGKTSEAQNYSMDQIKKFLEQYGAEKKWSDKDGQYIAEWTDEDGIIKKAWIEDAKSIEEKMKIYQENNLAGCAYWKFNMQSSDIWDVIEKNIGEYR